MSANLDFIKPGMTFQEMLDAADKSPVSRRAFVAVVCAGLAAGVALKPDEAYAWNSYNSKCSGVAKAAAGMCDCVHEDITQMAYAYATFKKMWESNGQGEEVTYWADNDQGWVYDWVPSLPSGLLNPFNPASTETWKRKDTTSQPAYSYSDVSNFGVVPSPDVTYGENLAFLRIGSFWNDSACDSITDFAINFLNQNNITQWKNPKDGTNKYYDVCDVARHMLENTAWCDEQGEDLKNRNATLIKFSMGERASFLHAMQVFHSDAATKLTQGQSRQFMLQWLGVAWEYARTGNPDNIEVEGLGKKQCRDIFDAFIDSYHQTYKSYGYKVDYDASKTETWVDNVPFNELMDRADPRNGNKPIRNNFDYGGLTDELDEVGSTEWNGKKGHKGYCPLNVRDFNNRSITMTVRQQRLRALGMFAHTIEDSWCAAHCSRTYPTDNSNGLKYKIVGFNHYYRQKKEGLTGPNRHKPYDQVCEYDTAQQLPGTEKANLRETLTYNPATKNWDFLKWYPDRYAKRGTNKLQNFAPRFTQSGYESYYESWDDAKGTVEYKILKKWYLAELNRYGYGSTGMTLDKYNSIDWGGINGSKWDPSYPCNPTVDYDQFEGDQYKAGRRLGFNTLGMSEAVNTMAALFEMFYDGRPWSQVRNWVLQNVLCSAFKNDNSDYTSTDAQPYICLGGRRSLDSVDLVTGYYKPIQKKHGDLKLYNKKLAGQGNYKSDGWLEGCEDPMPALQEFVQWQDWWEKYFNQYNYYREGGNMAECIKVTVKVKDSNKTLGYTEQEGLEIVKKAYKILAGNLNAAIAQADGDTRSAKAKKVAEIVGAAGMKQWRSIMDDFCGIYNEFQIQLTGKTPTLTMSASSILDDQLSAMDASNGWDALDNSDFDDIFDVNDNEEGQTVVTRMVSIQAIGANEECEEVIEVGSTTKTKWRPYMFADVENLEPFCAWVEADSDDDKTLKDCGEKAFGVQATFTYSSDTIYGTDYECLVSDIDTSLVDGSKAYRAFGKITDIADGFLDLEMYTIDSSKLTPITYPMTFDFADSYKPADYADFAVDDYVNLQLYLSGDDVKANEEDIKAGRKPSKEPVILSIISLYDDSEAKEAIKAMSTDDNNPSSEYFNEIKFTALKQAQLYDVFSNSLSAVTGEYDSGEDVYTIDHSGPYYYEGGSSEPDKVNPDDDQTKANPYTLISTILYDQGVLCDIPGQNAMDDTEIVVDNTLTAWVYQDGTIQDTQNRTYYMPVVYQLDKDATDDVYGSDDPLNYYTDTKRNFIDPLYRSYLAVGVSGNHYDDCDKDLIYFSDGAGKHSSMCDDYIIHDKDEDCYDEHGDLCTESGLPCVLCGWRPGFPDVQDKKAWYYDSVYKSVDLGLFSGYADGTFGPNNTLTRGQLAVVLWRYLDPDDAAAYDKASTKNETGMADVEDAAYYTGAANWAVESGVITGKDNGTRFDPAGTVTAEQFCSILYKTTKATAPSGTEKVDTLADKASISSWAVSACEWAMEKDVLHGYNADGVRTLRPQEGVSRARAATLLVNAIDNGVLVKEDFE